MGRARAKPKPEAVILPPELDDDEEQEGGGIPDDDGWIHLNGKEPAGGEDEGKAKPGRRGRK